MIRPAALREVILGTCLAVALGASSAAAQHQLCFYVDKGHPGHVFVQFLPVNGPQAGRTDLCRGKYAATWDIFGGPGEIKDDSKREWEQRICFPVTAAQYNAAAGKVNGKQAAPPAYHLTANPPGNCVNWVTDTATAAGLVLPNKTNPNLGGTATPGSLAAKLKGIGDGNQSAGGGTVMDNPDTAIGPDGEPIALNPPIDVDAELTAIESHIDPTGLASLLNLPDVLTGLGSVTTSEAGGLTIEVTNTSPSDALISVNWDDGSPLEAQANVFSHSYSAGAYTPTLAVVDNGTVRQWSWDLTVDPLEPALSPQVVNVPTPRSRFGKTWRRRRAARRAWCEET